MGEEIKREVSNIDKLDIFSAKGNFDTDCTRGHGHVKEGNLLPLKYFASFTMSEH